MKTSSLALAPFGKSSDPLYRGLAEKIRRLGAKYNIQAAFSSQETLRKKLTKLAPEQLLLNILKNCIYQVPCSLPCGKVYIGQTKCTLKERLQEHKSD